MKTYKIRNKADGGILEVTEDQLAAYGLEVPNQMAKGGMIKRADGSYSRRGLWDNLRKNKGSGKKPTKAMLEQERKIRAAEKAYGGYMDMGGYMNPYMAYGGYLPMAQVGDEIGVPMVEPSMLAPAITEDDSQPYTQIQRTLPEGVDYSSQVPFNMGVVQVGNVPVQVAMKQEAAKPTSKYVGLVDTLNSMGLPSDKESRKKYAKELGVKDYDFSAAKNTELLKKLKEKTESVNKYNSFTARSFHQPYFETDTYQQAIIPSVPMQVAPNIPVMGGRPELPYEEAVALQPQRMYQPQGYFGKENYDKIAKQLYSLSDKDLMYESNRSFFLMDPVKAAVLENEIKRRGYKNIDDLRKRGSFKNQQSLPSGVRNVTSSPTRDFMAYGGCKECGGKMQYGGDLFKEAEKGYPSDRPYIPLPPSDIIDYPAIHEINKEKEPLPNPAIKLPIGRTNLPFTNQPVPYMQLGGTPKPSYNFPVLMENPTAMDSAVYRTNFNQMLKQDPYAISQYQKMQKYGIPPTLDNETYTKALMWQNAYEDALSKLKKKESGGKLPKEILKARLESHMSPNEAQDYINKYQDGGKKKNLTPEELKWLATSLRGIESANYLTGRYTDNTIPGLDTKRLKLLEDDQRLQLQNYMQNTGMMTDILQGITPNIPFFNPKPKGSKLEYGGYLDEAGEGKWIQKATASIKKRGTEGVCTGSKFGSSSCPPGSKRYNLAKTFRKLGKARKKEEGGFVQGGEYEMSDAEIARLRSMGYKIKEV